MNLSSFFILRVNILQDLKPKIRQVHFINKVCNFDIKLALLLMRSGHPYLMTLNTNEFIKIIFILTSANLKVAFITEILKLTLLIILLMLAWFDNPEVMYIPSALTFCTY